MDLTEVDGLQIAYERAGSGPPLVLVHGFVGDGGSTWSRQLTDLSDEFTVVAWDAPGTGRSSTPPDHFRLPDFADCLAGLVRGLGFAQAHLVGLSFGGALVLELLARHPRVPQSLVLAGAYAGWAGSLEPEEVDERLRFCLRIADLPPEDFAAALLPSMFSASAPPDAVADFAANVGAANRAGFRIMAHSVAEADLRDLLGGVDAPVLLLHGEQDVRAPRRVADALHDAIPGSRLVVMPGVGHVSPVEAPELFNRHLREFLRGGDS